MDFRGHVCGEIVSLKNDGGSRRFLMEFFRYHLFKNIAHLWHLIDYIPANPVEQYKHKKQANPKRPDRNIPQGTAFEYPPGVRNPVESHQRERNHHQRI